MSPLQAALRGPSRPTCALLKFEPLWSYNSKGSLTYQSLPKNTPAGKFEPLWSYNSKGSLTYQSLPKNTPDGTNSGKPSAGRPGGGRPAGPRRVIMIMPRRVIASFFALSSCNRQSPTFSLSHSTKALSYSNQSVTGDLAG